jgi:hypothetical protein
MKRYAFLASLLFAGCASTVFDSRTDLLGDFSRHDAVKAGTATPRLYIETAPEDFEMKGGEVVFEKIRYEYLGKIFVKRNFDNWRLGFSDYNEQWRRYYCPPVVTATYGTAFLLFATPLPYFCAYENSTSNPRIEQRKKYMAYAAIEEGMKIGATHLVFAKYTGIEYPEASGAPSTMDNNKAATAVGSETQIPYMGMVAYAFKKK